MKKVCFITTSRADFGTINELIKVTAKNKKFSTKVIVSGSHTNSFFGNTYKEIKYKKNCKIIKINVLNKNTDSNDVNVSFADCVKKISEKLSIIKPNIFIVFGVRYDMLAATIAAYILRIPIVHIAGGEKTVGSIDDGFRHSISKLSSLHFPVSAKYKKRLIQLGEDPRTIFCYGSLNLLKIRNNNYLTRQQLEKKLKFNFFEKNLILTYHPDTINSKNSIKNLLIVLNSVKSIKNVGVIITSPNSDAKGNVMINTIKSFIKKNKLKNFLFVKSLGSKVFLSMLREVDGMVGNSSSGISEAPFFGIGTVNIGNRQEGRIMSSSIINCSTYKKSIIKSVKKVLSKSFKNKVKYELKKYGNGYTAQKISKKLLLFNFKKYEKKVFFDI